MRSLVCLAVIGTVLSTPPVLLFRTIVSAPTEVCQGWRGAFLPCVFGAEHLELYRVITILVLLLVASGYRPAWTTPVLVYVIFGYTSSATLADGGDQIAMALVLLSAPACLTDLRRWHWTPSRPMPSPPTSYRARTAVADVALMLTRTQVAVVYFFACITKLSVPAWVDGSALYYWTRHPTFGPASLLQPLIVQATAVPIVTAMATWGTLIVEMLLALGLVLPVSTRMRVCLPAGLALHFSIAVVMGLSSFSLVMSAALIVLLVPQSATVSRAASDKKPSASQEEMPSVS